MFDKNLKTAKLKEIQAAKAYFQELHSLFLTTERKDLKSWEEVLFFRHWFVAISDIYVKIYLNYHNLLRSYSIQKKNTGEWPPIVLWTSEKESTFLNSNKQAEQYYLLGKSLDLPLPKRDEVLQFKNMFTFPPVRMLTMDEADIEFRYNERIKDLFGYESLKVLRINLDYPIDVLMRVVKRAIEDAKTLRGNQAFTFDKRDKKGRRDTYPFNDWARYI